jgi:hypothetical protein
MRHRLMFERPSREAHAPLFRQYSLSSPTYKPLLHRIHPLVRIIFCRASPDEALRICVSALLRDWA